MNGVLQPFKLAFSWSGHSNVFVTLQTTSAVFLGNEYVQKTILKHLNYLISEIFFIKYY